MNRQSTPWLLTNRWLSLICGILYSSLSLAQSSGIGLWTGVQTDIRFTKSITLNINGQVRFSDNIQITRAYLGEAGLSYRLSKAWTVSGYYRYIGRLKRNEEKTGYYYRPYHRFYGEVNYDRNVGKRFKLDYRLRYQNQFKDDDNAVVADKSYLRNKVGVSYNNPSRFTPFVSGDLFYRFASDDGPGGFDQLRIRTGTSVQITRQHSLDLFLFADLPLDPSQDAPTPVIGANYKLKLGWHKSKNKLH